MSSCPSDRNCCGNGVIETGNKLPRMSGMMASFCGDPGEVVEMVDDEVNDRTFAWQDAAGDERS